MENPLSAVLWDMDGVLVDTGDLHYETWRQIFAERQIDFPKELFTQTFGMNNTGVLELVYGRRLDPGFIAALGDEKETRFRGLVRGNAELMPGVLDWLTRFQVWGWRQAIASSAPQENIDALVDALNIRGFFQAIVSGGDIPGKPDPAIFLKAAADLDVSPQECLVIEDSLQGIAGARAAGMRVIAVATTHPAPALSQADLVIERLTGLTPDMVKAIRELR